MKQHKKDERVLTRYQIRKQLIDDIVENGAKKALSKFRRSDHFNGRIILDFANCSGVIFDEAVLMRPLNEKDLTNNKVDDEKVSFVGANIDKAKFGKGTIMDANKITTESTESTGVYLAKKKERCKKAVKNSKELQKSDKVCLDNGGDHTSTS